MSTLKLPQPDPKATTAYSNAMPAGAFLLTYLAALLAAPYSSLAAQQGDDSSLLASPMRVGPPAGPPAGVRQCNGSGGGDSPALG